MSKPKNILIVEDETLITLNIEDTLTDLGHVVNAAATIKQAEQLLDAGRVDLAIVDYKVTDGDTDVLMDRLHQAGIPFIVCSGFPEVHKFQDLPQDRPFLSKPFTSDELIQAVTALIGTKHGPHDLH